MKQHFILLCLFTLTAACRIEPPCINKNPILDQYLPKEEPYKAELARLLEAYDKDKLTYIVEGYSEVDGVPNIDVHIENEDICATFTLMVTEPDKDMEDIIKTKAEGYFNAQLFGLKFDVVQQGGKTQFLYKDMNFVLD
jgi:hypothetical protein